jgi:hypothetical protein
VGSMDRPVWWDEETAAVAVHRTECTLATRSHYRYTIKQYFYKIGKNCILEDIYLHQQDDVMYPLLVTSQHFTGLVIPALAGPTG